MSEPDDNLYRVLQVDPDAEPEVIEAAYRALARKLHPDRNRRPDAQAEMSRLNHAHDVLADPARRAAYDRERVRALIYHAPGPPPDTGPSPPAAPREDGRHGHWLLALPLGIAAVIGLVLLVALGPLGETEIDVRNAPPQTASTATRTPRPAATPAPGAAAIEDTTSARAADARDAGLSRLLGSRDETAVERIEADVNADGNAELLVLARPSACDDPCKLRSILVVDASGKGWVIENQLGATITATTPEGFEVFRTLTLQDDEACCPTTASSTFYAWDGDRFVARTMAFEAVGATALSPVASVRRFYELLNGGRLLPAYAMLSRRFQESAPFEVWSIQQQGRGLLALKEIDAAAEDLVRVRLEPVGAPGGGVTPLAGHEVTWRLVHTPLGWRLDEEINR